MQPSTSSALSEAAGLGAAGRYPEAHAALAGGKETAHRLLRARLFAQEGRYGEAIDQWQSVLDEDPEHAEARAGIRRARAVETAGGSPLVLRAHLIQGALLTAVVVLGILLLRSPGSSAVEAAVKRERESLAAIERNALAAVREVAERADRRTSETLAAHAQTVEERLLVMESEQAESAGVLVQLTKGTSALGQDLAGARARNAEMAAEHREARAAHGAAIDALRELIERTENHTRSSVSAVAASVSELASSLPRLESLSRRHDARVEEIAAGVDGSVDAVSALKLRVDAVNSELTTQRQVLSRLGEDVLAIGTSVEESGATVRQLVERHAGPATCLFCRLNERMATRRCSRETGSPPGGERPRRDR